VRISFISAGEARTRDPPAQELDHHKECGAG
jgi:hypothetical protein